MLLPGDINKINQGLEISKVLWGGLDFAADPTAQTSAADVERVSDLTTSEAANSARDVAKHSDMIRDGLRARGMDSSVATSDLLKRQRLIIWWANVRSSAGRASNSRRTKSND